MDNKCVLDSHVNTRLGFTAPCKDFNVIYQKCVRYIWRPDVTRIAYSVGKYLRMDQ